MMCSKLGAFPAEKQNKRERRRLDTIRSRKDLPIQSNWCGFSPRIYNGRESPLFAQERGAEYSEVGGIVRLQITKILKWTYTWGEIHTEIPSVDPLGPSPCLLQKSASFLFRHLVL